MGCTFDHDATPPICNGDADVKGTTFKYGRFVEPPTKDIGSMFIPVAKFANDPAQKPLTRFEKLIDNTLIIQWCPTENHFKVLIDTHIPFTKPAGPFFLRYAGPRARWPSVGGRVSLTLAGDERCNGRKLMLVSSCSRSPPRKCKLGVWVRCMPILRGDSREKK